MQMSIQINFRMCAPLQPSLNCRLLIQMETVS